MGTGDGRFVLDQARQFPHKLCIGIDAAADAMRQISQKTKIKPERGGVSNALFVWASVEDLPPELYGIASEITVNYPWGSLLHALVEPNPVVLKNISRLARSGALLTVLVNISVFENPAYYQKLGLSELNLERAQNYLVSCYRDVGINIKRVQILDQNVPHRTTWGQKLTKGSGCRKTLFFEAII
ncbi:MAG: class I SAM-dependent methyltransferase [Proteobacteria bacterium]|nr:class I SAM-dependent methyltransferase [Pseudomonadota bacterium]